MSRFSWLFITGRSNNDIRAVVDKGGGDAAGGGGAPAAGLPACSRSECNNFCGKQNKKIPDISWKLEHTIKKKMKKAKFKFIKTWQQILYIHNK